MNVQIFMQSRSRKGGLIFGIWTLVVIVEAAQHYASRFVEQHTFPLGLAIRRAAEEWYTWAFLTIAVLWVARRCNLQQVGLKRWISVHVGTSVLVSLVYLTTYAWFLSGQKSVMDGTTFEFG